MTGKGRCNDNAYIERFWRRAKYAWLKLKFIPTVEKLKMELANLCNGTIMRERIKRLII